MRLGTVSLLAVIPLSVLEPAPPPCAIAIEMQVRAPFGNGRIEWRAVLGEAQRIWAPYGIVLCWSTHDEPCAGVEVRIRVLVDAQALARRADGARVDALGWIGFDGNRAGREIVLSLGRARWRDKAGSDPGRHAPGPSRRSTTSCRSCSAARWRTRWDIWCSRRRRTRAPG
jgi:hypothetical protein